MLSWDDFRYVKAIADNRSLSGAATTLGVNHSTVFRRLGQIERQLASRLFERGRAGYSLTSAGEEMVRLADRMGEEILAYERKVTGCDLRPSGELRITTNDLVLLHLLTDVLVGFRLQYPEIILEVVVSNQMLNLSKRDADIALRATYQAPEGLTGRRVGRIAWAVFGSAAWEGKSFDPLVDVPAHDWIGLADHVVLARASKWLRDRGADKRTVYRVNTMLGFAEAVAGGIGLALLPCFIGARVPGLARLSPPVPELEGELWVLTHPDLRNTARVRAFVDFCAAEFAQQRKVLECLP